MTVGAKHDYFALIVKLDDIDSNIDETVISASPDEVNDQAYTWGRNECARRGISSAILAVHKEGEIEPIFTALIDLTSP